MDTLVFKATDEKNCVEVYEDCGKMVVLVYEYPSDSSCRYVVIPTSKVVELRDYLTAWLEEHETNRIAKKA